MDNNNNNNPKFAHEPALKDNGKPYRPYMLDDTQQLQAFQGFLCRHCHTYYADPEAGAIYTLREGIKEFPPQLKGSGVCPAKVLEAMQKTIF